MSHNFETPGSETCPFMPVFGPPAIMFERGSGTELWDSNGKRYLDFLAGIAVVSLGHSHPAVAQAIGEQAFENPQQHVEAIRATDSRFETGWGNLVYRFVRDHPAEAAKLIVADELPVRHREYRLRQAFKKWADVAPGAMLDFVRTELEPAEGSTVLEEVLKEDDFPAATARLILTVIEEISSP